MKTAREIIARAYDREQAAQMGEPDPWQDGTEYPEWEGSLGCADVAIAALAAEGFSIVETGRDPVTIEAIRAILDDDDADVYEKLVDIRAALSRSTMSDSNWIMLGSGRPFRPFNPDPADIDIADIARALSRICRYGAHTSRFYSVAEHSCLVADFVPARLRLAALLHDAAEAYLGDIPRPIKKHSDMAGWRIAEERVEAAIAARFGLPERMDPAIKEIDDRIILDEWNALMPTTDPDIGVSGARLDVQFFGWDPATAEAEFLHKYEIYRHYPQVRA